MIVSRTVTLVLLINLLLPTPPIRWRRPQFRPSLCALWGNPSAPQTLGEFETRGIMTNTGRLLPRDATIQVLILPVLLVIWGLAFAVIAALVA